MNFEPYLQEYTVNHFSHLIGDIQFESVSYAEHLEKLDVIRCSSVVVICLNFEDFYTNLSNDIIVGRKTIDLIENDCINKCKEMYYFIKSQSVARIIWFGFEDYYIRGKNYGTQLNLEGVIDRLNLFLNHMLKEDTFIDFKRLIATVGIDNAYDARKKYRWNAPYSNELLSVMSEEIYKQHLIASGVTKKCLILDCDNVLWGGILSEDGIEGITISNSGLGRSFHDFQQYLLELYYHGVILAICSKNDEMDVLNVFQKHTGMLLNEEHIACFKCNWSNKADNIKNIADELNIDVDSIVFIDDSIFEIELVKNAIPKVTAVLYNRESIYDDLSCFNLKKITDLKVVKARTETFKSNVLRNTLEKNSLSYGDYLSSLEMRVDIHKTTNFELSRISELTQRTNKCTNGVRYNIEQLKRLTNNDNYTLYTVCLSDKYGDLGIVGTMGLTGKRVDLFSLSCRALGRNVEEKMVDWLLKKGAEELCFVSTNKNDQLKELFPNVRLSYSR